MEKNLAQCRLIGFCGRAYSGKTTFANILVEKYGFKRLYFAQALKNLCCELFNMSLDQLNANKNTKNHFILSDSKLNWLGKEINVDSAEIKKIIRKKVNGVFKNTREILQIIGTDIIRKYNPNWHLNKLREMMDDNEKYVIDDVRFSNELKFMEDNDATMFFIVRPSNMNVSNHPSEIGISWQEIPNIIINDKSLDEMLNLWDNLCKGEDNILEKEFLNSYYEYLTLQMPYGYDERRVTNPLFIEDIKKLI